ncbi:MAG: EcsC family protein [Clostridium sp.]
MINWRESPWEKEWNRLVKQENAYLKQGTAKKDSALNRLLAEKVPPKLQETLNAAFAKAFRLVFDKGTDLIEKTYKREDAERQFKIRNYAVELKEDRKGLRQFSRQANRTGQKNLLLSGIEGVGLGALGIGLPDIPLFVGMLLKSIYEIALHFGYTYESPEERYFILEMIQTALSYGDDLNVGNQRINDFIENGRLPEEYRQERRIEETAAVLSNELLYMKFLQGIPLLGAVGGMYDAIYLQKVQKYAKLKYHRRFLYDRKDRAKL